jgi:capsular polysaccharide biosynthesis protein
LRTGNPPEIIWGARDDYLELLATSHRHIITVALPWLKPETSKSTDMRDNRASNWSSLADFSNVLIQKYYSWSADDKLCTLIETPGAIKMKYDALWVERVSETVSFAAGQPQSLVPVILNSKPISRNHYWPNNGDSLPSNFYTNPPPYVFYMHVHSDAFVNGLGDVFSGHSALLLYLCRDSSTEPQTTLPADAASRPLYDEVLTVTQHWGTAVFHRMVEVVPRIAVFVEFLKAHPTIKIHAPGSAADRLNELVRMLGLDDGRLVYGSVRAKIVYQPRATGCGMANVQESQLTSKLYRDYIGRSFSGRRNRDRLILIRRSGSRKFTEQSEIERLLKQAAADFGLTYELFPDNPTPSLNETMMMFNAAVMVVAPHGAGLSNILFSEPGTFVVEGVCNVPHVNLCFQRLAYVLGHRWHGLTSRGGCESVVDVPAIAVDKLARDLLGLRKESTESH